MPPRRRRRSTSTEMELGISAMEETPMNREEDSAGGSRSGRGQLVPATVLECSDSSPLLRRRLVAVEVRRASEHTGTPPLARAVNAPSHAHASLSSTATSRLGKAVTSHRTPNGAASRPCGTRGRAARALGGSWKTILRADCRRGDAKCRELRSPSPLNGERVGVRGGNTHRVRLGLTSQFVFVNPLSAKSCVFGSRGLAHPSPSFPLPVEGRGRSEAGSPVTAPICVSSVLQFPSRLGKAVTSLRTPNSAASGPCGTRGRASRPLLTHD